MRIGIDARLWNETGVGRYIRSLFKYIGEIDKKNDYVWFFRKTEFDSIDLPNKNWRKVLADVHWHSVSEQIKLPVILSKENLDLLHFPYFSFPIFYPGKFVVTVHDLIYDHFKSGKTSTLPFYIYFVKKLGYFTVMRVALRRAQKIITLSMDSKREIMDHYSVNPDRIAVTYESGSLEDKTKEFSRSVFPQITKLQPYILYVGNAHPHKNVNSLIEAISYIRKEHKDWKLVLLGDDKFFYGKIKQIIDNHNLTPAVFLAGEVPNTQIAAWYHFAQCLVSASNMEGFGIPPLEAMSLGCPVFVSDIPVFHEIYDDAAVYFRQNNPQDIATTILKTMADKEKIKRMIANGYRRVKLFSWEKMARETISIYENSYCL